MSKSISSGLSNMASTIESSVSCYPTSNNTRKRRRPPYSYTALIAQAIISSEHQQLTLRQIYDSINQMYPQMCQGPDIGWQNTIRHNLSLNQCFKRIPRQQLPISLSSSLRGRGSYWSVDVELMDPNTRKRLDEAVSMAASAAPLVYGSGNNNINKRARISYPHTVPDHGVDTKNSGNPFTLETASFASEQYSKTEAFSDQSSRCSPAISATKPTAYTLDNNVRCVSPTIQSSTLYFQSGLNSPISNVPRPAIKQIMHSTSHRSLPGGYTNECLPPLPSPLPPPHMAYRAKGFSRHPSRKTQLGVSVADNVYSSPTAFWDQGREVSAASFSASPYLYGTTISHKRSTVRSTRRELHNNDSIEFRQEPGSGSTSTFGSRQASPYSLSPPSSFTLIQDTTSADVNTNSSKLRIKHLLN